jgi:hypothetical protein
VAAAAKKKRRKSAPSGQWGFRLAGIVLCAFFVLGLITGLSGPGHQLAQRIHALLALWPHHSGSALIPDGFTTVPGTLSFKGDDNPVALVRRDDGFCLLDAAGDLRGPIVPEAQPDLPILSGDGVASADSATLVRDAAILVRAEAGLNHIVSEMAIESGGNTTLFLENPPASVIIDLDRGAAGIQRAARILNMWRGHERMLASIDLTGPDEAVVRLREGAFNESKPAWGLREASFAPVRGGGANHHPPRHAR